MAVELTDQEKKIVEVMKDLGATSEEKMKTADDITKKVKLPKPMVANNLISLTNKKIVKRVVRQKAAGYHLII